MKTTVIIFIVLGALATAAALVKGIVTMASGRDITGEQSNKLMSYRVMLQFATVAFVVILILLVRAGY